MNAMSMSARLLYACLVGTYMQRVYAGIDIHHEVHLVQVTMTLEACHCTPVVPVSTAAINKQ